MTYKYTPDKPTTRTVDVLANDVAPDKGVLTLDTIDRQPNFGYAEIVNNKINYTANPNVTTNADSLTYTVKSSKGLTGTGTLRIRFENPGQGGGTAEGGTQDNTSPIIFNIAE